MKVGPLRRGQGFGSVEAVVELGVEMHDLVAESATEGRHVDGESVVAAPDVLQKGGRRLKRLGVDGVDGWENGLRLTPGGESGDLSKDPAWAEFAVEHRLQGVGHGWEIRWGKRLEQAFAIAFQADGERDGEVLAQQSQPGGDDRAGAQVAAGGELPEGESEAFEPGEVVVREVGKPAESEGLGHQTEVLQDHAHLEIHEVGHELFEMLDGDDLSVCGIVIEMSAPAAGEPGEAGRTIAVAFIENEDAGILIENLQQPIEVHGCEIADWQEVRTARSVEGPSVGVDVEQRFDRWMNPAVGDLNADRPVEAGPFPLGAEGDGLGQFRLGEFVRTADQPGALVVDDEEGNGLETIPAGDRASDEAGHDVAAVTGCVAEIGEGRAGDAARRPGQQRLVVFRKGHGGMAAAVSERAGGHFHAQPEPAGTAILEGVDERGRLAGARFRGWVRHAGR